MYNFQQWRVERKGMIEKKSVKFSKNKKTAWKKNRKNRKASHQDKTQLYLKIINQNMPVINNKGKWIMNTDKKSY